MTARPLHCGRNWIEEFRNWIEEHEAEIEIKYTIKPQVPKHASK